MTRRCRTVQFVFGSVWFSAAQAQRTRWFCDAHSVRRFVSCPSESGKRVRTFWSRYLASTGPRPWKTPPEDLRSKSLTVTPSYSASGVTARHVFAVSTFLKVCEGIFGSSTGGSEHPGRALQLRLPCNLGATGASAPLRADRSSSVLHWPSSSGSVTNLFLRKSSTRAFEKDSVTWRRRTFQLSGRGFCDSTATKSRRILQ